MFIAMVVVFILGYTAIALEHPLKIDKFSVRTIYWNSPVGIIYIWRNGDIAIYRRVLSIPA